jgi:hypothetical protein
LLPGLAENFAFRHEKKTIRQRTTDAESDSGTYLTVLGIAAKLGGAQFKQARMQAVAYAQMATSVGGKYTCYNAWLGTTMFP